MRVLGISPLDKDSTVSFVEDGRVLFACGEERLSRVKLQSGFPAMALELGLSITGWSLDSIDRVAYAFFDWQDERKAILESAGEDATFLSTFDLAKFRSAYSALNEHSESLAASPNIPGFDQEADEYVPPKSLGKRLAYRAINKFPVLGRKTHQWYFKKWIHNAAAEHKKWSEELLAELSQRNLDSKLVRFHHHDTHAANAFFASGIDEALCLILDGYGSGCCGGIYHATAEELKCLHRFKFPYSLGVFYEQVTSGLGFQPSRHEGKIVGLAAYGRPERLSDVVMSRFRVANGDIKIVDSQNYFFARDLATRFPKRDVAAAYQSVLEKVTVDTASHWVKATGLQKVVMSGGVHANVKLNQRVYEIDQVESVFVYPNMGDGGCATGAALLAFESKVACNNVIANAYFGTEYDAKEIRSALERENVQFENLGDELEERVAQVLSNDGIVARFNGRMEYGPRALGNRSILYPARDPSVNQWLNEQLGRTEFMPFAPAVLVEDAQDLFHGLGPGSAKAAEFMTITFDCTDTMKSHSPAAVHIDGTARPQIVTAESNPSFHKILTHYKKLTGIPVLINTSFNMHEEPIVCSPDDAVRAFLLGNIHYLAAGSFLAKHPKHQTMQKSLQNRGEPKA